MKLYKFTEAAKALRIHKRTLYKAVQRLGWKRGPCGWRFDTDDLKKLAKGER